MHGKSKFDQRTLTWEDRLFLKVPRMEKDDPRYLPIVGQDFKTVDVSRTTVHFPNAAPRWNDPRELPKESEVPEALEEPKPSISSPDPLPPFEKVETSLAPPSPAGVKNLPRHLLLMNAPSQPTMLPGALPAQQQAFADPWLVPASKEDPSAPIVKKGARIKFGATGDDNTPKKEGPLSGDGGSGVE
jgi:hypothetical protein